MYASDLDGIVLKIRVSPAWLKSSAYFKVWIFLKAGFLVF